MCIAHRVDWVVLCNKKGYYIIISYVNVKTESKLATLKKRNKLRHLWGIWVVSQNTNEWRRRGHRQTDYRTRLTDFGKLRGGGAHLQPEHTLFRLSGTDKQLLSPSPSVKWLTNNKGREDKVNPVDGVLIFICTAETSKPFTPFFITHSAPTQQQQQHTTADNSLHLHSVKHGEALSN